jgi:hypothetical protein
MWARRELFTDKLLVRLQHMLDSARVALMLSSGRSRENLTQDIGLVLALMKSIENIGKRQASCPMGFGKRTRKSPGKGSLVCAIG